MADKTLASLTAATPATGGLLYGTQGGADRKFTVTAAGAALMEASNALKLDELAAPTDVTTLNATTSAHGLLPKLGGGTTNFLRADGAWAAPAGGGTPGVNAPGHVYVDDMNGNDSTGDVADPSKAYKTLQAAYNANSSACFILLPKSGNYTVSLPGGASIRYKALIPRTCPIAITHTGGGIVSVTDEGIESTDLLLLSSATDTPEFVLINTKLTAASLYGSSGTAGAAGTNGADGAEGDIDSGGQGGSTGGAGGNGGNGGDGGTITQTGGSISGVVTLSGGVGGNGGNGGGGGNGGNGGSRNELSGTAGGNGGDGGTGGTGGNGGNAGALNLEAVRVLSMTLASFAGTGGLGGSPGSGGSGGVGNGDGSTGSPGNAGSEGGGGSSGTDPSFDLKACVMLDSTLDSAGSIAAYGTQIYGSSLGSMSASWYGSQVDGAFYAS